MAEWRNAVSSTHQELADNLEVSNDGQVRKKGSGKIYRGTMDSGKPTITIKKIGLRVHHLVAETFIARRDAMGIKQIKHKDGDYSNNAVSNLEYVSHIGHNGLSMGQKRYLEEKVEKLKEEIQAKWAELRDCNERLAKFPKE